MLRVVEKTETVTLRATYPAWHKLLIGIDICAFSACAPVRTLSLTLSLCFSPLKRNYP